MTVVENEYRVIGPPGCLAEGSLVFTNLGHIKIERLNDEEYLDALALSDNGRGGYEFLPIVGFKNSGVKPTVCIETEFGHELFLTADHDVLTKNGKVRADRLFHGENFVHTTDGWAAIVSVMQGENCKTYDITVGHPSGSGNYFANGILVSNCGKTTYLSSQVTQRVERWCADTGLEPHQCQDVLVSSLTKAAAGEVLSRGLSLPDEQVGTLHAHALHALGNPKLCVGSKQISEWNKQAKMDHWIKGGAVNREEDGFSLDVGQFRGDELMNEYTINRCRMTPRETWRADVVEFADAFEKWKFMNSYMDYTDLIDTAFRHKVAPPGNPSTILVDECQDHDRLELRLLRYWATRVNKFIMVGDQDQAIFEWRGSDPGGFYDSEIPEGHTKVLEQSYRVPRAVHKTAMQMIERCGEGRKPVVYHPRDEEGEVTFAPYSLRMDPVEVVRDVERMLEEPDSKPGRAKVMILTTCAYMTQPITTALRDAGIPFWNPYSRERSNFNPLHPAKGMSTLDRILRYLKPNQKANGDGAKMWTWSDFYEWSDMCNAEGWLRHGQKAEIKRRAASTPHQEMSVEDIEGVLSSPAILAELEEVDLGFLAPRITDAKLGVYNYVVDIQRKRGYNSLSSNPRVVVGTIHSVKGAEADHVILSPDLSSSGWEVYGSKHIDSLHRLFYVGLTRAYRRLVLCQASSPRAIQW